MADVALDDYIKTKHITRSGRGTKGAAATAGRGARGGSRGGKVQRQPTASQKANRFSGGIVKNVPRRSGGGGGQNFARNSGGAGQSRWTHDLYGAGAGGADMQRTRGSGTKLIISNLDYGVSESDIRDLFSELGTMSKASVHYDVSGRSLGTAEIVYARAGDAVQALKKYNGVPLDGKPMEIQLINPGKTLDSLPQRRSLGNQGGRGARLGNAPAGRARGGRSPATSARGVRGRRGGARGGGQTRTVKPEVTQEQLDMELDEYQSSAAKTA